MQFNFSSYNNVFFDCDGVLLNSNHIKTQAFKNVSIRFGQDVAEKFIAYHVSNGGVSRYEKFEYLITNILGIDTNDLKTTDLLSDFSNQVEKGLMAAEVAEGLHNLRKDSDANWFVVSGGDQEELRKVFKLRGIDIYFNGGVWGSPATKYQIIENLITKSMVREKSLFIGDSKLDFEVSRYFNFDFVFLRKWSEVKTPDKYFLGKDVLILDTLKDITKML